MGGMKFEIDEQTIRDLEIFHTHKKSNSVFSLFDYTRYNGGREKLYAFLSNPLTDVKLIVQRRDTIAFFQRLLPFELNINDDALGFAEYYLKQARSSAQIPSGGIYLSKFWNEINPSKEFFIIEHGAKSTVAFLKGLNAYATELSEKLRAADAPETLREKNRQIIEAFAIPDFKSLLTLEKIKVRDAFRLDYLFRRAYRNELKLLIDTVYEYDAYIAAAKAAQQNGFSYPRFTAPGNRRLHVQDLFHPFLENAVPSTIELDGTGNLLFVSGPNMAGKSTFLKALGIATFLAHTGLPVPAKKMELTPMSGICATINLADDLGAGYSHFYAEVLRVKKVVEKLKSNHQMLVIFDELFRGTNVKDAYDGTLAIVTAFAKIKTSFFVVSSHIVEVANNLSDESGIRFGYFEVGQKEGVPQYTYRLRKGISDMRLGMYIIRKEKLIEDIESIIQNKQPEK